MTELSALERLSLSHKFRKQSSFGEGNADERKKPSGNNWKIAPGSVAKLRGY